MALLVLARAAEATFGPPPSDWMYAASWTTCLRPTVTGPRSSSGPTCLPGIRPVLTWKSTAAAPTPIRLGAWEVPCALMPWQVAQLWLNSPFPAARVCGDGDPRIAADAGPPVPVRAA